MRKGYPVNCGYMGYIEDEGRYMLFSTEDDYNEYLEDLQKAQNMSMEELRQEIENRK